MAWIERTNRAAAPQAAGPARRAGAAHAGGTRAHVPAVAVGAGQCAGRRPIRLPARQLAEICQFSERRAGDLAVALRTSGFVDADWRLHDWGDYTGRLIDQRAASRERQRRRRARLRAAAMEENKEDGT